MSKSDPDVTAPRLVELGTACLVEALGGSARWTSSLRQVAGPEAVAGRAQTVATAPGDNLALHHAVAEARAGTVLVVATGGRRDVAVWGEILGTAAARRGVRGLVTDGAVRDVRALRSLGSTVVCAGTAPARPSKRDAGRREIEIDLGGLKVVPGDWIVVDVDGLAVVPASGLADVLERAAQVRRRDLATLALVQAGRSTLDTPGDPLS